MIKVLALFSIVGVVVLGAPSPTLADDRADSAANHRHHEAAPEPVTAIGLALGAGVIGLARRASKRKST
jgi:hypothetical protein